MDKQMQKIINGLVAEKEKNEEQLSGLKTQWEDVSKQLQSLREKKEEVSTQIQEVRQANREITEKVKSLHIIGNELKNVGDIINFSGISNIGQEEQKSETEPQKETKEVKVKKPKPEKTLLSPKIKNYIRQEVVDDIARTFGGQEIKKRDLHPIIKKSHNINTENSMRVTTSWYIKYMCVATDIIEEKNMYTLKLKDMGDGDDIEVFEDVEEYESALVKSAKEDLFR